MITAAGSEPGPGGLSPGAAIRTGCADRPGRLPGRAIQRATPMILCAVEQVHQRAAQTTWLRGSEADRCPAWLYVA
jgi:hypothetical protein